MAESISKQVFRFLQENPSASNQDLYDAFPETRPNTLRHYKSKFALSVAEPVKKGKKSSSKKALPEPRPSKALPGVVEKDLEERLSRLEAQMRQVLDFITPLMKDPKLAKKATRKPGAIDKKFKEVEDSVTGFFKDRGPFRPTDLKQLEEWQHNITGKIASLVSSLKKQK